MLLRFNGTVGTFYARLRRKKIDKKAIVASTAKLLRVVFWVLKEKRPHHSKRVRPQKSF